MKKGAIVECRYDGNTEEFTITIDGSVHKVSNINADNCKLYPYIYMHRKGNNFIFVDYFLNYCHFKFKYL